MEHQIFTTEDETFDEISIGQSTQMGETPKAHTISRKKKTFQTSTAFNRTQEPEETESNRATRNLLQEILNNQKAIIGRIDVLENIVKENVLDRSSLMAQSHTLRECKVVLAKVRHSVARLVGEVENTAQVEIAARLPILTIDAALDFEEHLQSKEYADETKIYIFQLKGGNSSIDDVLRKMYSDDVLFLFNWDGRKNKRALNKLVLINEILFDVFKLEGRPSFEKALRKCVELSHNRYRQKKLLLNRCASNQSDELT